LYNIIRIGYCVVELAPSQLHIYCNFKKRSVGTSFDKPQLQLQLQLLTTPSQPPSIVPYSDHPPTTSKPARFTIETRCRSPKNVADSTHLTGSTSCCNRYNLTALLQTYLGTLQLLDLGRLLLSSLPLQPQEDLDLLQRRQRRLFPTVPQIFI
jgi:hypothetical protein